MKIFMYISRIDGIEKEFVDRSPTIYPPLVEKNERIAYTMRVIVVVYRSVYLKREEVCL